MGGRCQELALAAARELARRRARAARRCLRAAPTAATAPRTRPAAIVDKETWGAIARAGRDAERDLAAHDSHRIAGRGGRAAAHGSHRDERDGHRHRRVRATDEQRVAAAARRRARSRGSPAPSARSSSNTSGHVADSSPFTIGLVQQAVPANAAAAVDAAERGFATPPRAARRSSVCRSSSTRRTSAR